MHAAVFVDGTVFNKTVRHTSCAILGNVQAVSYRDNLRSICIANRKREVWLSPVMLVAMQPHHRRKPNQCSQSR